MYTIILQTPSLRPDPESSKNHNRLRYDILRQPQQHARDLREAGACIPERVLELDGDTVEL